MLGIILAGAVLGAASLVILGNRGGEPARVPLEIRDRRRNRR
jgi:hypothetical protein